MPRERTTDLGLDPPAPTPVRQQITEVDRRGRLHVPSAVERFVDWLGPKAEVLVVLDELGRLTFLPWENEGTRILARRSELLEMADKDEEANELLVFIEDRYKRIIIPQDRRPTLRDEILLHLGIFYGLPTPVYLEIFSNRLRILSPAYRNNRHGAAARALSNLP